MLCCICCAKRQCGRNFGAKMEVGEKTMIRNRHSRLAYSALNTKLERKLSTVQVASQHNQKLIKKEKKRSALTPKDGREPIVYNVENVNTNKTPTSNDNQVQ